MPVYYRLTLTLNRIPIHRRYYSARLTVFLFSYPSSEFVEEMRDMLYDFAAEVIGYDASEWWGGYVLEGEEIVQVLPEEARGLGFYRVELVFEDPEGVTIARRVIDIRRHYRRVVYDYKAEYYRF